jgi:hypothetical protein
MERGKRPFSLQRRPTRNKHRVIYYAQPNAGWCINGL